MILLRVAGIWRWMWCAQGVGHKEPAENTALTITLPDRYSQTSRKKWTWALESLERLRWMNCFYLWWDETCWYEWGVCSKRIFNLLPVVLQRREGQKGDDGASAVHGCLLNLDLTHGQTARVRRYGPMSNIQQEPGYRCLLSPWWLKAA